MKYVGLVVLVFSLVGGVVGWSKFSKPLVLGYDVVSSSEESEIVEPVETNLATTKPDTDTNQNSANPEVVNKIKKIFDKAKGTYSMYVYRLDNMTSYGINENVVMSAASMMKVPIMTAAERAISKGNLKIDQIYILKESDKRSGSGPLEYYDAGTKLSVNTLLREMGKKSDNTAPVILVNMLGEGMVEKEIQLLGMKTSSLKENTSTAEDMGKMWNSIYNFEGITDEQRKRIKENLSGSIYEDRIPEGLPDDIEVIHKVGTGNGVWGDSGIIYGKHPFVLVIMNKDVRQSEAEEIVPQVTKLVWEYERGRE